MKGTKKSKDKETELTQAHIANRESTHDVGVSDPVWMFLLKLHQRYTTESGELKVNAESLFKANINEQYPESTAENKLTHDAFSRLTALFSEPVSEQLDRIPEHLVEKMKPRSLQASSETGQTTRAYMPLMMVFSLVYQATMDDECFPETPDDDKHSSKTSSRKARLLTLFNTVKLLFTVKSGTCHFGVRNDLVHTLNLIFTFPGSEKPVFLPDDLNLELFSLMKQQAKHFLQQSGKRKKARKLYNKLMLQWIKEKEMPTDILELLKARHPKEPDKMSMRVYIEQQLEKIGLASKYLKNKLDAFLSDDALQSLGIPKEPGKLYYEMQTVFDQPETVGDPLRDQAFSQFKREVEKALVGGRITYKIKSQLIQCLKQFLQIDKAFLLCQQYRSVLTTQQEFGAASIEKSCRDFYQKCQPHTPGDAELKSESQAQHPLTQVQLGYFNKLVDRDDKQGLTTVNDFIQKVNKFLTDSHASWIENFFILYQAAPQEEQQIELYRKLFSLHKLGKVSAPDEWLQQICQSSERSSETSIVNIRPYEINRIVLHAILIPPQQWTESFTDMYTRLLEQLNGEEFAVSLTRQFRDNSYPEALIEQLVFINKIRQPHITSSEAKSTQDEESFHYPTGKKPVLPMHYLIRDVTELFFMLRVFRSDQAAFIDKMGEQLQRVIQNAHQLTWVLEQLNPDQHGAIIDKMAGQLQRIIQDSHQLAAVLTKLNSDQQGALIEKMGAQLQIIIPDSRQLTRVLAQLNPDQHGAIIDKMVGQLQTIIQDSHHLADVLTKLNPNQHGALIEKMGAQLKTIIQDDYQLARVLMCLNPDQHGALIDKMVGQLNTIIPDYYQLARVLMRLNPDQYGALIDNMGEQFNTIITTGVQLAWVLAQLKPEQQGALIDKIGGQLQTIIQDTYQLVNVLRELNSDQQGALIEKMGAQLQIIIPGSFQLTDVLTQLNPDQYGALIDNMGVQFNTIITDGIQLGRVLAELNPGRYGALIKKMSKQLKTIITKGDQLAWVLAQLNPNQQGALIDNMGELLNTIITNGIQLGRVLAQLNPDRYGALIDNMGVQFNTIITDGIQLAHVLAQLNPDQYGALIDNMGVQLNTIITKGDHLAWVLERLNPGQQGALIKKMSEQLQTIIQDSNEFAAVLAQLKSDQQSALIEKMGGQLNTIIINGDHLAGVLARLNPDQQGALIEKMGKQLKTIIINVDHLGWVLAQLNPDRYGALIDNMGEQLNTIITKSDHLAWILAQLKPDKHNRLLPRYKQCLLAILNNQYQSQFGHLRGYSKRMQALKKRVKSAGSIDEIHTFLRQKLKVYDSQAKNKENGVQVLPSPSLLGSLFTFFKPGNLQTNKKKSNPYQAGSTASRIEYQQLQQLYIDPINKDTMAELVSVSQPASSSLQEAKKQTAASQFFVIPPELQAHMRFNKLGVEGVSDFNKSIITYIKEQLKNNPEKLDPKMFKRLLEQINADFVYLTNHRSNTTPEQREEFGSHKRMLKSLADQYEEVSQRPTERESKQCSAATSQ